MGYITRNTQLQLWSEMGHFTPRNTLDTVHGLGVWMEPAPPLPDCPRTVPPYPTRNKPPNDDTMTQHHLNLTNFSVFISCVTVVVPI